MRALIFTDVNGAVSARLIRATLRAASEREDFEVRGIVTSRPHRFAPGRVYDVKRILRQVLVAATNHDVPFHTALPSAIDLTSLSRRAGIPIVVPPTGDPNDPAFIETLRGLDAEVALSYDCLSVFRAPLLATFRQAVNYHAGLLSQFRGVMATSFAILAGAAESGFTFHRMTEQIDAGPILVEGAVPVAGETVLAVAARKLDLAVQAIPRVLEMIAAEAPGRRPESLGTLIQVRDWQALLHVSRPEDSTAAQLRQRIRAFGVVHIKIRGTEYPVTRLQSAGSSDVLAFRTADGLTLAPSRLDGLPRLLYRALAK